MGENTSIEWATHTFNPWIGCEKVSAGCKHCYASVDTYARVSASRGLPLWGPGSSRHRTSTANWKKPFAWNRATRLARLTALQKGLPYERPRVFCASLCDVFEAHPSLDAYRADLWPLIEQCAEFDWMLLTKRPENIRDMVPPSWLQSWPAHVWTGTSVEDQPAADKRIQRLREVPAAVRFLSMEPLLEAVDLEGLLAGISLVIVGGESGPGARPFDLAWARSIRDQCKAAGVPFFFKQAGALPVENLIVTGNFRTHNGKTQFEMKADRVRLKDKKGGDLAELPADLRIREMPAR